MQVCEEVNMKLQLLVPSQAENNSCEARAGVHPHHALCSDCMCSEFFFTSLIKQKVPVHVACNKVKKVII